MGDNLAELLYMAWRCSLLSSTPDLPSWGNVRDPDVRAAWEAAATKARSEVTEQNARLLGNRAIFLSEDKQQGDEFTKGMLYSVTHLKARWP
jgi:hypothetical protein